MRSAALFGVACILPVCPLLGAYRDSCRCECCIGLGCSPRLACFCIAWTAFGFSCLGIVPSIAEKAEEVGGKVLFGITQTVSIGAMAASRRFAEIEEEKALGQVPTAAAPGTVMQAGRGAGQQGSILVGAPVQGPSTEELQDELRKLQTQVRDLVRLQTMQLQAGAQHLQAGAQQAAAPGTAQEMQPLQPQPNPQLL